MPDFEQIHAQEVSAYALKVLSDAGCNCYTYDGEYASKIMDDLKQGFPGGMKYPYIEVANAILSISRPPLIYRSPFKVIWETDDACDSYDAVSLEAAKTSAIETLIQWEQEESEGWAFLPDGTPNPTAKQKESWDYMVYNCIVRVAQYNPSTDEYDDIWDPDDNDLLGIGWHTFEE